MLCGKVLAGSGLERALARIGLGGLEAVNTQNQKFWKRIVKTLFKAMQWNFLTKLFCQNYINKQLIWELFQQIMHRDIKKEMVLASFYV